MWIISQTLILIRLTLILILLIISNLTTAAKLCLMLMSILKLCDRNEQMTPFRITDPILLVSRLLSLLYFNFYLRNKLCYIWVGSLPGWFWELFIFVIFMYGFLADLRHFFDRRTIIFIFEWLFSLFSLWKYTPKSQCPLGQPA